MLSHHSFGSILLGAGLFTASFTAGCATLPDSTDDLGEVGQAFEEGEPAQQIISMNGLPPGILTNADYQAQMATLASGAMSSPTALTDMRDGRTLLSYLAVCALPDGVTVITTASDSTQYRLSGHIGLAPGWATGAITATEKRWVSACMLAHANAYGLFVEIDLHGAHPALAGAIAPGFDGQEAAFYGDLFQDGSAFACIGSSASDAEGMPKRVCGRSSEECHFFIAGTCAQGPLGGVCTGGPKSYDRCETDDPEVTMDEVITVYTRPGTFSDNELCSHSPLEEGLPLAKDCSPVTGDVCNTDPYCCETAWDSACVNAVNTL